MSGTELSSHSKVSSNEWAHLWTLPFAVPASQSFSCSTCGIYLTLNKQPKPAENCPNQKKERKKETHKHKTCSKQIFFFADLTSWEWRRREQEHRFWQLEAQEFPKPSPPGPSGRLTRLHPNQRCHLGERCSTNSLMKVSPSTCVHLSVKQK